MKPAKIQNVQGLTTELCSLYEDMREGAVDPKVASAMNNTAGKIISAAKLQLDYMRFIAAVGKGNEKKTLQFFELDDKPKKKLKA